MKKIALMMIVTILILFLSGCTNIFHEHKFIINEVLPTCTETGTIVYTCECGDTYTETVSEPLGHEYGDWEVTQTPTMTSEGIKQQICIRCNNKNTELIEKKQYPNLGGYTIKIAHEEHALMELDPFLDYYTQQDKEAKQRAWKEVEELFNCKIEVVPYPSSVMWGSSRINYILQSKENPEYDFYYESYLNINKYARNGAILNLDDFYMLHGNNLMNNVAIESGKFKNSLYSFSVYSPFVYHIIAYNLDILQELQELDPTLEEPAKIFNDGNWTIDVFIDYCEKVQILMEKAYGSKGQANSKDQEYYAINGYEEYWWVGLSTGEGKQIIDSKTNKVNIDTPYTKKAADILKNFYQNGIAEKNRSSISSKLLEKMFFINTTVIDIDRYKYNFLEEPNLGYVPWPRSEDSSFDDFRIAIEGVSNQFIMASGRDYSQYGEECTAENIYWALVEVYNRTKQYYEEEDIERVSGAYLFKSEESKKAIKYIYNLIQDGKAYYEPFLSFKAMEVSNENNISTTRGFINQYCVTNKISTWDEAIKDYTLVVKKYLQDNFQ